MRKIIGSFVVTFFLGVATAYSLPIVLDFEGVGDLDNIEGFYNGGVSSAGHSGTNFGVEFSSNALGVIDVDAGGSGNFGGEPSPDTIMFFLGGSAAIMSVSAGFDTGFSFFYTAINQAGSVDVWDDINGSGNLLASLFLPTTPFSGAPDPNGAFSPLVALGVGFSGIAKSVSFGGVVNQIGFDNITFGAVTPGGGSVPEPSTIILLGAGFLGLFVFDRQHKRKYFN